jgi:hypothetical protein
MPTPKSHIQPKTRRESMVEVDLQRAQNIRIYQFYRKCMCIFLVYKGKEVLACYISG